MTGREISRSALLQRRRVQRGEIGLCFFDALSGGLLEPQARLRRVWVAGGAFGEIAAEHQLGLAVAQLGGGAEPTLRGLPVFGQIVTAGSYCGVLELPLGAPLRIAFDGLGILSVVLANASTLADASNKAQAYVKEAK